MICSLHQGCMDARGAQLSFLRVRATDAFGSQRTKIVAFLLASVHSPARTRAAAANHKVMSADLATEFLSSHSSHRSYACSVPHSRRYSAAFSRVPMWSLRWTIWATFAQKTWRKSSLQAEAPMPLRASRCNQSTKTLWEGDT